MKLHEEDAQKSKETVKARLEKKRRREAQMVIPDASTLIFEKQLRKIATKGGEQQMQPTTPISISTSLAIPHWVQMNGFWLFESHDLVTWKLGRYPWWER